MKPLNLNALETTQRTVEFDGASYSVKPMTAVVLTAIDAADNAEKPIEQLRGYADAVALLVPDMPRAVIDHMTVRQHLAICKLASREVDAVEEAAADPNAESSAPASPVSEPAPAAT